MRKNMCMNRPSLSRADSIAALLPATQVGCRHLQVRALLGSVRVLLAALQGALPELVVLVKICAGIPAAAPAVLVLLQQAAHVAEDLLRLLFW
jgi:hypothetical protein